MPRRQWLQEFDPKVSQLGPAIAWLVKIAQIPGGRLAGIFKTTPANIRVLAHRYQSEVRPISILPSVSPLAQLQDSPEIDPSGRTKLGIRGELFEEDTELTKSGCIENEIESRFESFSKEYRFLDGARNLKQLRSYLGIPGEMRLVRQLIRLQWKTAWFLVHSGWTASALDEAQAAIRLSQEAYRETLKKEYLQELAQASLIASNASLLSRRPSRALRLLELTKRACEAVQGGPGSEYYRQLGTVFFQIGESALARKNFSAAMKAMERLGEAQNDAQIDMAGARKNHLLDGNFEGALELLHDASRIYGPDTLEYSMNVHWAAACGLIVDDSSINRQALDLLESNRHGTRRFGHQATVADLLLLTLELGLPSRLRHSWVRRALYENAFRTK